MDGLGRKFRLYYWMVIVMDLLYTLSGDFLFVLWFRGDCGGVDTRKRDGRKVHGGSWIGKLDLRYFFFIRLAAFRRI